MSVDAKAAVAEIMENDIDLVMLLTGGIYSVAQLNPTMEPPSPYDAVGRVRPCALIRKETSAATGPRNRFDRQFVVIFFYDYAGYDTINAAMIQTRQLLHERRIGDGAYQLWHVDTIQDQYDDALLAYMHRARYEVTVRG
jgi:hypothetical protein